MPRGRPARSKSASSSRQKSSVTSSTRRPSTSKLSTTRKPNGRVRGNSSNIQAISSAKSRSKKLQLDKEMLHKTPSIKNFFVTPSPSPSPAPSFVSVKEEVDEDSIEVIEIVKAPSTSKQHPQQLGFSAIRNTIDSWNNTSSTSKRRSYGKRERESLSSTSQINSEEVKRKPLLHDEINVYQEMKKVWELMEEEATPEVITNLYDHFTQLASKNMFYDFYQLLRRLRNLAKMKSTSANWRQGLEFLVDSLRHTSATPDDPITFTLTSDDEDCE